MRVLRSQRGDTMVEVLMAVAVLSLVLISALAIANRSYTLGRAANERTQAVNLMQSQGEALHDFRDKNSWNSFKLAFSGAASEHYMKVIAGEWKEQNGRCGPPECNFAGGTGRVWVVMTQPNVQGDSDKAQFEIRAEWTDATGSHTSTIITQIANIDLTP